MVNLLHLCENMLLRWCNEDELRVPVPLFENFAKRNNFHILKRCIDGRYFYKLVRWGIPVFYISGNEEKEFRFMDIADLHIGHPNFDELALREKLASAISNGVERVFIAGDVFEGVCSETVETHYYEQIEQAYSIFKDYPLKYYVINGNHDYTFEQVFLTNPIERLATRLKGIGIDFQYFDAYLVDFVICGVVKRVMHVERQDFNKKSIFAILKLKMFDEDGMLQNTYQDVTYPVRFFQVGHIHVNVQMYYAKKMIYISQSGSFIRTEKAFERANIISGRVIDHKVFMN